MSIELTVPEVGESITEVQIGRWLQPDGANVKRDEDLVEIETEKASVVVAAPEDGVLAILKPEGEFAQVGDAIARIALRDGNGDTVQSIEMQARSEAADVPEPAARVAADTPGTPRPEPMPAAARLLLEHGLEAATVAATGPGGRLLKEDVLRHVAQEQTEAALQEARAAARSTLARTEAVSADPEPGSAAGERGEQLRPMSMMRRTIASRLVQAQANAALLTTFNEIDMSAVKELRARHQAEFEKEHGVRLGFMSFFVRASVQALRQVPAVNAEIRGNEIAYRDYQDIGIAIGSGKGLVVPILRNAEKLGFAAIEKAIAALAERAQQNRIGPDELQGGTFTISNGGIYGSLLSTPIVNPPQSAILGMHAIQDRPVVRAGEVVVRPMMYVALTYDHRLIDGREAVTFLHTIKQVIEEPARLFLEI